MSGDGDSGSIHENFSEDQEAEFKTILDAGDKSDDGAGSGDSEAASKEAAEAAEKAASDQKAIDDAAAALAAEEGTASGKTVPLEALHESRQQNRETREQLVALQKQLGQFQGLKTELEAMRKGDDKVAAAEALAKEEELFKDDPIAALTMKVERLQAEASASEDKTSAASAETKEQQEKMAASQAQMLAFQTDVKKQVATFEETHPDYSEAFKFVMERRFKDFAALGITDAAEQQKNFDLETMAMANNAMQRGVNPAQAAYSLAENWGYKKADAGAGDGKGGDKTEAEKAAAAIAAKKKALEDQIKALEKGQNAASTLSGGGGGAPEGELSLSDIEGMSDADFDKMWDENATGNIY